MSCALCICMLVKLVICGFKLFQYVYISTNVCYSNHNLILFEPTRYTWISFRIYKCPYKRHFHETYHIQRQNRWKWLIVIRPAMKIFQILNLCCTEFIAGNIDICSFSIISQLGQAVEIHLFIFYHFSTWTGSWNPISWQTGTCLFSI